MNEPLRIALADDEEATLNDFQESLVDLGHEVVCLARTGAELVEKCRDARPDLVITDIKMPDMDGLEAASQIRKHEPVAVILVSAYHEPQLLERAVSNEIMAYLTKPVKQADLQAAIALVTQRFKEVEALRAEAQSLRQALEDRKVIERAKGILMRQAQLDEEAAFRRLQRIASDNNKKLIEVAQMIILTADALSSPDTA